MRIRQSVNNPDQQSHRLIETRRFFFETLVQRGAGNEVADQVNVVVGLTDFMHLHNVGVSQLSSQARFPDESAGVNNALLMRNLDGDMPAKFVVTRYPDCACCTTSNLFQQPESTDELLPVVQ